ncbi:MAG: quinohemoprotein amine dehydrogenase subunit alpha [Proteobacteria bacterium]|nr:quinohemoprotein amine dehydrogenase subunit alpha [Pseudomonadota bacterium]
MSIGLPKMFRLNAALLGLVLAVAPSAHATDAPSGQALVRTYCSGCHLEHDGAFERINSIRKTPEGWVMTLFRMHQVHGLALPEDVHDGIVRYLSDTQGLAPSEAAPARFALERRPNAKDLDLGPELATMCGRCHSLARVALQRRDSADWLKHMHFHVGQFTSLEYQASGRDRPWWTIASTELPPKLGQLFPLTTPAWTAWSQRAARDLSGSWVVVGHEPGGRDLYGTAEIAADGHGGYTAHYRLKDTAGTSVGGESHAIVYTGYEWRGRAELGGRASREVFAASEDGSRIVGRWFDPEHTEEGGDWTAVRNDAQPQVLAVLPRAMKAGSSGSVIVVATGITSPATLSLGAGTTTRVLASDAGALRASVEIASNTATGARTVSIAGASGQGAFAVYDKIDKIEIRPSFGIARVGGGKIAAVTAQFEAIGQAKDAAGNTLALGPIAADWSTLPYDAEAARTHDEAFGGGIQNSGRYVPAGAGLNPVREFSGNNTANLKVVARVRDGTATVEGDSHLIVTVQRWITTPIY